MLEGSSKHCDGEPSPANADGSQARHAKRHFSEHVFWSLPSRFSQKAQVLFAPSLGRVCVFEQTVLWVDEQKDSLTCASGICILCRRFGFVVLFGFPDQRPTWALGFHVGEHHLSGRQGPEHRAGVCYMDCGWTRPTIWQLPDFAHPHSTHLSWKWTGDLVKRTPNPSAGMSLKTRMPDTCGFLFNSERWLRKCTHKLVLAS